MVDTDSQGRMLAASPGSPLALSTDSPSGAIMSFRRRVSPSATEQARREAWGREWGAVGAEYKRRRLQGEKR